MYILAGAPGVVIFVYPVDDNLPDGDETVVLTLLTNDRYTVGEDDEAYLTIVDDLTDDGPVVTISVADPDAYETDPGDPPNPRAGVFEVSRTGDLEGDLEVFFLVSGTAHPGSDYDALQVSVTILDGYATAELIVTPVNDPFAEGSETVVVTLLPAEEYLVGTYDSAQITITDDVGDAGSQVYVVAIDDEAMDDGSDDGTFRIHRTGSTSTALTVNYTVGGTAEEDVDYDALSGTAVIPIGESYVDIDVTAIDDDIVEEDETVVLTLTPDAAYDVKVPTVATVDLFNAAADQLMFKGAMEVTALGDLDANPNPGGGLRAFGGASKPGGAAGVNVFFRVKLTQEEANKKVYFRLIDVDDPSSDKAPVDDERQSKDNRQEDPPARLTGQAENNNFAVSMTNAKGEAIATFYVGSSRKPGDNYRVVASLDKKAVEQVKAKQNDGKAASVLDGAGKAIPFKDAAVIVSPMLTAWRTLHVETGSMGNVTGNTVSGAITGQGAVDMVKKTVEVTTNQNLSAEEPGRFVPGKLTSFGKTFEVVGHTTGPNSKITVKVIMEDNIIFIPGNGEFTLVDDDLLKDGDDVPGPDTSTLEAAMAEAYIAVVWDVPGNEDLPFVANVESSKEDLAKVIEVLDGGWTSKKLNSEAYWVTFVMTGFQGRRAQDGDPNTQQERQYGVSPGASGGALIFWETIVDTARATGEDAQIVEQDTVVHEIGHAVANYGGHPVTGADAKDMKLEPGDTSKQADGAILVTHHNASRYTLAYLDRIRSIAKPASKTFKK